ncbi:hypothetical protein DFH09DRAFT_1307713 [Mycena vulgaris]|nr:hypothetical protein DFH09DRAFT_1307713 [Mycena vulgaris]
MRAGNSLPLDDDTVYRIFTLHPNFETLDALRGHASKLDSTAVANNSVGPRCPRPPETLTYLRYQRRDVSPDSPEFSRVTGPYLISVREKAPLASNAAVVHNLEAIFSRDFFFPSYLHLQDIPLFTGFFSSPLAQIWESREAEPPPEDCTHLSSILDVVPDGLDSCTDIHLTVSTTTQTLQASNARCRPYIRDLNQDPSSLLPGKLQLNSIKTDAMSSFSGPRDDWPAAINSLIGDIYRRVERQPCENCLIMLMKAHLHLWLLWRKMKGDGWWRRGTVVAFSHRYGYNCNTQVRNTYHVMTKNHLCAPAK